MNTEAAQMIRNRYPRPRKPWAIKRVRKHHYTIFDGYHIVRPGRFFYCEECGRRMTASDAVIKRNPVGDRDYLWSSHRNVNELICPSCAISRGVLDPNAPYGARIAEGWFQ